MTAPMRKRSSVPYPDPQKPVKRSARRNPPTSQYTDVGQRRPSSKPKPTSQSRQTTTVQSTANEQEVASKAVAAAKQLIALEPAVTSEPSAAPLHSAQMPDVAPRRTRRRRPVLLVTVLFVLLLVGLTAWRHARQPESVASLVSQVGRVTVLPANETPVVSTVVDKQRVTQPFLANAQNGDKVLLYYQAKQAIVYRPSTHQVITIGPIAQGTARVFIRGGGASAAALKRLQARIASEATAFTLSSQDVSPNPHYRSTAVVDLTGVRPDVASKLAALLHAKVSGLPAGEQRPDGDLLVIAGSDAQ